MPDRDTQITSGSEPVLGGPVLVSRSCANLGFTARGSWVHGSGLSFIDCDLPLIDLGAKSLSEPTGLHQFLIQCGTRLSSVGSTLASARWPRSFGTLQMLLPTEGAGTEGPAVRTLLVAMTPEHLQERIADQAHHPMVDRQGRTCMSNFSVTLLASAHDEGVDMGFSGRELYLEDIRMAIESRLVTLFLRCILGVEQAPETMAPTRVMRVVEFIEDNLANGLLLGDLSEVAGLSKFHFSRAFRQTLGMTPHAFVMSRRLARALDLLRNRHPIGKAAMLCGFSDPAHLSRSFKCAFGIPPSAFF